MPWLTPDSIPEGDTCRPLSIPSDSIWLALVSGALTELTQKYNWQQFGSLTVDETVAKMQEIVDSYYAGACACRLPGGGHIIRIGEHGHIEELGDDGTWGDPTGDYIIPPPTAREGGTEQDQNCLAAKNAVNVMDQLYETLSEAWASHLSEAEALTEFTLAIIAIIGFEAAPITFAIVAFFEVVFAALYTALEYLGADLWDENFTDQMTCFLLNCVNNDEGVITFDYDCLMGQLNSLTDSFGLTELQIRLYLQVSYIIYFIGGIDGLNLAARTTEISDDDCSFCALEWCKVWPDFALDCPSDFTIVYGSCGENGMTGQDIDSNNRSSIYAEIQLGALYNFTHAEFQFSASFAGANRGARIQGYVGATQIFAVTGLGDGTHVTFSWDGDATIDYFIIQLNSGTDPTEAHLESCLIRGTGDAPNIGEDCP